MLLHNDEFTSSRLDKKRQNLPGNSCRLFWYLRSWIYFLHFPADYKPHLLNKEHMPFHNSCFDATLACMLIIIGLSTDSSIYLAFVLLQMSSTKETQCQPITWMLLLIKVHQHKPPPPHYTPYINGKLGTDKHKLSIIPMDKQKRGISIYSLHGYVTQWQVLYQSIQSLLVGFHVDTIISQLVQYSKIIRVQVWVFCIAVWYVFSKVRCPYDALGLFGADGEHVGRAGRWFGWHGDKGKRERELEYKLMEEKKREQKVILRLLLPQVLDPLSSPPPCEIRWTFSMADASSPFIARSKALSYEKLC